MANSPNEEPEEGEIVDDYEDVSDSSMQLGSPINSGKCVSPELLSAVSLNSLKNMDVYGTTTYVRGDTHLFHNKPSSNVCRRKRKFSTRLTAKRQRNARRRKPLASHSDSDNETVDPKYIKQLREALGRESSDLLHNSLRTRLKGFIEPTSRSEDELELRDLALLSSAKPDENEVRAESTVEVETLEPSVKVEDSELQKLRIEALRSFVLENHNKRKRKAQLNSGESDSNQDLGGINKENDQGVINESLSEVEPNEVDLIEEDVDNLRALVLASMTSKLIEKSAKTNSSLTDEITSVHDDGFSMKVTKTINNDLYFTNKMKLNNIKMNLPNNMVVKPLIIQVGNDSDSEIDEPPETQNEDLKETVAEFLKKQRAQVEAKVKATHTKLAEANQELKKQRVEVEAKIKAIPTQLSVAKVELLKKQRAQVDAKASANRIRLNETNDEDLDKSGVKLLPRSKQLEYRRLKLQLLNAKRKNMRVRKISQNKRENIANSNNVSLKKVPKLIKTNVSYSRTNNISVNLRSKIPSQERNDSTYKFHPALNGLQILKNGRLQMKGKYRSLGPLLNKVNQANSERMLHEKEIKGLLQQIQQVRSKLSISHQQFINYIQELVRKKDFIDQRSSTPTNLPNVGGGPFTSTPKKETRTTTTSEDVDAKVNDDVALKGQNKMEIEKNKVLLDPNDITETFSKTEATNEEGVLKYTSPLDKRYHISDPHVMMCPYDLLGVCKDNECGYLHCS